MRFNPVDKLTPVQQRAMGRQIGHLQDMVEGNGRTPLKVRAQVELLRQLALGTVTLCNSCGRTRDEHGNLDGKCGQLFKTVVRYDPAFYCTREPHDSGGHSSGYCAQFIETCGHRHEEEKSCR